MSTDRTTPDFRPGPGGGLIEGAIGGLLEAVFTIVRALLFAAWWLIRRPRLSVPLAAAGVLVYLLGPTGAVVCAVVLVAALVAWRLAHARSFRVAAGTIFTCGLSPRAIWRRLVRYRPGVWRATMVRLGLAKAILGSAPAPGQPPKIDYPRLRSIVAGRYRDRLLVQIPRGVPFESFEVHAPTLAHSFRARSCRVRPADRPGYCVVELAHGDPLAKVIPALDPPNRVDLAAVPIGRRDDGQVWTHAVLATQAAHTLVVGASGAGKGSVVWSLIRGLLPAIRSGRVQVHAVDPKGGMELGPGRGLFARFAVEPEEVAELLEAAVAHMQAQARRLAARGLRRHEPTPKEPLVLVVIDEIAALTAYGRSPEVKARITNALGMLLTQGRAPGVTVVGAVQDARKQVVAMRDLFPNLIALRLNSYEETKMLLDPATAQTAACHRIPKATPGVAWVLPDGAEPERVRAAYVTDEDIAAMVAVVPAQAPLQTVPDLAEGEDPSPVAEAA